MGVFMNTKWDYSRCLEVLNGEIALLGRIFAIQRAVREAVLRQEWTDFDWKIAEVKQMGLEFAELDDERATLFSALAQSIYGIMDSARNQFPPFYTLASRLPEDERRELSRLYRIIKIETLKMQALNESFLDYLNEAKTAASACIEAAFPARGGKLYNRKGSKNDQDLKSMVFNRHV